MTTLDSDSTARSDASPGPGAETGPELRATSSETPSEPDARAGPNPVPGEETEQAGPDRARLLFRYLSGDGWQEYRVILSVFAGTFFAEFTPDDVIARLAESNGSQLDHGPPFDPETMADRLESLRRWGNLTVSSSIGNPASLADYYRRRNRYLITREGQEVFDLTEGVLTRVDEVRDVQSGRLRDLHRALRSLIDLARSGLVDVPPSDVADSVRAVFDPHDAFTTEITQFFAAINQWQSRYDLEADQLRFFAEVLVGYVSEQLADIERSARPIARALAELEPMLDEIVGLLTSGLAARVDEIGLADRITVGRISGADRSDWLHLSAWFSPRGLGRSRLDDLTRQAVAAVRTLTVNLTRLSGIGMGSASRRADFVRLARFFADAPSVDEAHDLAAAAFGLGSARHQGVLPTDSGDPVATSTSWTDPDGPTAAVPISLRDRGEVTQRGRPSPIRDRSQERELLRRKRERTAEAELRTAAEILAAVDDGGDIDGVELSQAAFVRLRDLIGRSSHRSSQNGNDRSVTDAGLRCVVRHRSGANTTISSPEGKLRFFDLVINVSPIDQLLIAGDSVE